MAEIQYHVVDEDLLFEHSTTDGELSDADPANPVFTFSTLPTWSLIDYRADTTYMYYRTATRTWLKWQATEQPVGFLRQFQRDDARGVRMLTQERSSRQTSTRQGVNGSYY